MRYCVTVPSVDGVHIANFLVDEAPYQPAETQALQRINAARKAQGLRPLLELPKGTEFLLVYPPQPRLEDAP